MLDMSWGEVMLIGGVALIVIGPKDLPKALRTLGQVTSKVRRMAGEFQHQFNEAIREADLEEIKREVDGVRRTAEGFKPSFSPVDTIRNELKNAVEGRKPKGQDDTADPLASTSTAAIASSQVDPADRPMTGPFTGGTYDVPRFIEPPADETQRPIDDEPRTEKQADGRTS